MFDRISVFLCIILVMIVGAVASADLVGHYRLDQASGTMALDDSGNGFDGEVTGDPNWVVGYIAGAIDMNGGDRVVLPADQMGMTSAVGSVAFWFNKPAAPVVGINTIWWGGDNETGGGFGPENEMHIHVEQAVNNVWLGGEICFHGQNTPNFHLHPDPEKADASNPGATPVNPILINDGMWHHLACTWDNATGVTAMHLDGVLIMDYTYGPEVYALDHMYIGGMANGGRTYTGMLDEMRIYSHPLSDNEIAALLAGEGYPFAFGPKPTDQAIEVPTDAVLTWNGGEFAAAHDVYFSTSFDDVNDANEAALVSAGQVEVSYDPGMLDYGETYYWRIVEVNEANAESPWVGPVWSFTVLNFFVLEDFESYNDVDNIIYDTWIDGWVNGTGSTVGNLEEPYAERTIVHSGAQSMPFTYDNFMSPNYSEASRTWDSGQDWTANEVSRLGIWTEGAADNAAEALYMAAEDGAGNVGIAVHPAADILQQNGWQEWIADMSAFSDAGVDLTNVTTLHIGVGNRVSPVTGFGGTIYVDDLRLYRPEVAD